MKNHTTENIETGRQAIERLCEQWAALYGAATNKQDRVRTLDTLSTIVAASVLKKCEQVAGAGSLAKMRQLRASLQRDVHNLDNLSNALLHAYATRLNDNGDPERVTVRKDLHEVIDRLINMPLSDAYDLKQDAAVAILEISNKTGGRLLDAYIDRRIKRRVLTWSGVAQWEERETVGLSECHKAVRRAIMDNGAVSIDPASQYTYIEDVASDPEDPGHMEAVYRRLGKCADLGGYAVDYNGKEVAYTVAPSDVYSVADVIARLNLTERQTTIVRARLAGLGYKAIAARLGCKPCTVQTQINRIRDKARAAGFTPAAFKADPLKIYK